MWWIYLKRKRNDILLLKYDSKIRVNDESKKINNYGTTGLGVLKSYKLYLRRTAGPRPCRCAAPDNLWRWQNTARSNASLIKRSKRVRDIKFNRLPAQCINNAYEYVISWSFCVNPVLRWELLSDGRKFSNNSPARQKCGLRAVKFGLVRFVRRGRKTKQPCLDKRHIVLTTWNEKRSTKSLYVCEGETNLRGFFSWKSYFKWLVFPVEIIQYFIIL